MHVLILTHYYAPEPVRKPIELAEELNHLGHKVSVITGFPNYPTGKLYPGYQLKFLRKTHENGIELTRTYEYPYHGKNAFRRSLNYISAMLSAPFGLLRVRKIDVIYVLHPPLTIGIAAWWISFLTGAPIVYDIQDIWPESVVVSGLIKNKFLIKIMELTERFVYQKARSLIVVTKGARENLIGKGVSGEKIHILPHITDDQIFQALDPAKVDQIREKYNFGGKFVFMFAGNLGTIQGLETVISAAATLKEDENILIVLVGDGSEVSRLKELVASHGLEGMVQFIGRQPIENIPEFLASADALLVHLKPSPLADYVIPYKTTAYLAVGKPILMATGGAAGELIKEIGAGITIDPGDPSAMAEALKDLSSAKEDTIRDMGDKGRQYFLKHLAKDAVIPQYENLLRAAGNN